MNPSWTGTLLTPKITSASGSPSRCAVLGGAVKPAVVGRAAIDPQRGAGRQLKDRLPCIVVQAGPAGTHHANVVPDERWPCAGAAGLTDPAETPPTDTKRKETTSSALSTKGTRRSILRSETSGFPLSTRW